MIPFIYYKLKYIFGMFYNVFTLYFTVRNPLAKEFQHKTDAKYLH